MKLLVLLVSGGVVEGRVVGGGVVGGVVGGGVVEGGVVEGGVVVAIQAGMSVKRKREESLLNRTITESET